MAKKPVVKRFTYVLPHIGTALADDIKKQVVDDYVVPELEAKPGTKKLEVAVKTWQ